MAGAAPGNFLDVSLLKWEGDIDKQLAYLLEHVQLRHEYLVSLRGLLVDLQNTLRRAWPGCTVHAFGSMVSGLGIKSSDLDVFVNFNHASTEQSTCVELARTLLSRLPWKFSNVHTISTAKVPIVKFLHNPTGCKCDINFKSEAGVTNTNLISHLLDTDPKALKLAIIIKYWAKVFKISGSNLLSNYALTLLVIFYLQGIHILAPIVDLQKSVAMYMVEGWNYAFNKWYPQPQAYKDNMYHLLGGFFKYYSLFEFNKFVVSPFLGKPVMKDLFSNPSHGLNKKFKMYKKHLVSGRCESLRVDTFLCIQDPFEHSRNCSMVISKKLFDKMLVQFKYAAIMYRQKAPDDFLKAVFSQDPLNVTMLSLTLKYEVQTVLISKKKKKKTNQAAKQDEEMQGTDADSTQKKEEDIPNCQKG